MTFTFARHCSYGHCSSKFERMVCVGVTDVRDGALLSSDDDTVDNVMSIADRFVLSTFVAFYICLRVFLAKI